MFTKHLECIQEFKETGNLNHIYKNELDKAFFPHDDTYFDSKYLTDRTISGKILKDRTLHKKWGFPVRLSSVTVSFRFGHIYWGSP